MRTRRGPALSPVCLDANGASLEIVPWEDVVMLSAPKVHANVRPGATAVIRWMHYLLQSARTSHVGHDHVPWFVRRADTSHIA